MMNTVKRIASAATIATITIGAVALVGAAPASAATTTKAPTRVSLAAPTGSTPEFVAAYNQCISVTVPKYAKQLSNPKTVKKTAKKIRTICVKQTRNTLQPASGQAVTEDTGYTSQPAGEQAENVTGSIPSRANYYNVNANPVRNTSMNAAVWEQTYNEWVATGSSEAQATVYANTGYTVAQREAASGNGRVGTVSTGYGTPGTYNCYDQ